MFGRSLATFGVPRYGPPKQVYALGKLVPHPVTGPSVWTNTLLGEEPVDRWQRELVTDERVQPAIRQVCRIHVTEEARHVAFAREELEKSLDGISKAELRWHQLVTAQAAYTTMRSLVSPQVYAHVGIDPRRGRRAALGNPQYRETIAWMGEKVVPYLDSLGLIPSGGRLRRTWEASFLLRRGD